VHHCKIMVHRVANYNLVFQYFVQFYFGLFIRCSVFYILWCYTADPSPMISHNTLRFNEFIIEDMAIIVDYGCSCKCVAISVYFNHFTINCYDRCLSSECLAACGIKHALCDNIRATTLCTLLLIIL